MTIQELEEELTMRSWKETKRGNVVRFVSIETAIKCATKFAASQVERIHPQTSMVLDVMLEEGVEDGMNRAFSLIEDQKQAILKELL
jgi:hypothetical protein